jgi:hypothetical protein
MILEGEYEWEFAARKSSFLDLHEDVTEKHVSAHRLPVRDDRFAFVLASPVPAVELNASTPREQHLAIDLCRTLPAVLPPA